MSYKKADAVLPPSLLLAIQEFVDGEYIYIPRKTENRKSWGERSQSRQRILERNREIVEKRKQGCPVTLLAEQYFLSSKSIYKILSALHDN